MDSGETWSWCDKNQRQTIYPVAGASGGAILNPWLRIPTKLVSREPVEREHYRHQSLLQISKQEWRLLSFVWTVHNHAGHNNLTMPEKHLVLELCSIWSILIQFSFSFKRKHFLQFQTPFLKTLKEYFEFRIYISKKNLICVPTHGLINTNDSLYYSVINA